MPKHAISQQRTSMSRKIHIVRAQLPWEIPEKSWTQNAKLMNCIKLYAEVMNEDGTFIVPLLACYLKSIVDAWMNDSKAHQIVYQNGRPEVSQRELPFDSYWFQFQPPIALPQLKSGRTLQHKLSVYAIQRSNFKYKQKDHSDMRSLFLRLIENCQSQSTVNYFEYSARDIEDYIHCLLSDKKIRCRLVLFAKIRGIYLVIDKSGHATMKLYARKKGSEDSDVFVISRLHGFVYQNNNKSKT